MPGTLTVGGWGPYPDVAPLHAATGTVVSDTATYSEVGSFAMHVEDHSFAGVDLIDTPDGSRWVDARVSDDAALARWGITTSNR